MITQTLCNHDTEGCRNTGGVFTSLFTCICHTLPESILRLKPLPGNQNLSRLWGVLIHIRNVTPERTMLLWTCTNSNLLLISKKCKTVCHTLVRINSTFCLHGQVLWTPTDPFWSRELFPVTQTQNICVNWEFFLCHCYVLDLTFFLKQEESPQ